MQICRGMVAVLYQSPHYYCRNVFTYAFAVPRAYFEYGL